MTLLPAQARAYVVSNAKCPQKDNAGFRQSFEVQSCGSYTEWGTCIDPVVYEGTIRANGEVALPGPCPRIETVRGGMSELLPGYEIGSSAKFGIEGFRVIKVPKDKGSCTEVARKICVEYGSLGSACATSAIAVNPGMVKSAGGATLYVKAGFKCANNYTDSWGINDTDYIKYMAKATITHNPNISALTSTLSTPSTPSTPATPPSITPPALTPPLPPGTTVTPSPPAPSPPPPPPLRRPQRRPSIISNGGFERGGLGGWRLVKGRGQVVGASSAGASPCAKPSPSTPRSGAFLFSSLTSDGTPPGTPEVTVERYIDLSQFARAIATGRTKMTASGYVSGAEGCDGAQSNDTAHLELEFRSGGPGGRLIRTASSTPLDPVPGAWNQISIEGLTVPPGTDFAVLRYVTLLDPGYSSIDILADDFSVHVTGAGDTQPGQAGTGGNLINNGSFEAGPDARQSLTLQAGSRGIAGWTVTKATVDYIGTLWDHAHGNRSIDMSGTPGAGALSQSFPTIPNQRYMLRFSMAGNPEGPPVVKGLTVKAAGQSYDYTFDVTGKNLHNMGWTVKSWVFTAKDHTTTLEFISQGTGSSNFGAALDDVSVMATREPATPMPSVPEPELTDGDGDGVPDIWDRCPDSTNAPCVDRFGCPNPLALRSPDVWTGTWDLVGTAYGDCQGHGPDGTWPWAMKVEKTAGGYTVTHSQYYTSPVDVLEISPYKLRLLIHDPWESDVTLFLLPDGIRSAGPSFKRKPEAGSTCIRSWNNAVRRR